MISTKPMMVILFILLALDASAARKKMVFWLSVDGLAPGYLEKSHTPHLDQMIKKGWLSRQLIPAFPSVTFPSHSSQATGVLVQEHGITGNSIYDMHKGEVLNYPNDTSLLQAEPLWETVKQAGLRSAAIYWPLSYAVSGKYAADYFMPGFDVKMSDEERIEQALKIWSDDTQQGQRLSLIMAYIVGPDHLGHQLGPHDPKVFKTVAAADAIIGKVKNKIMQMAQGSYGKEYDFYFLVTADHGMVATEYAVNFNLISQLPPKQAQIKLLSTGTIGHVYLNQLPPQQRQHWLQRLKQEYAKYPFLTAYERSQLPPAWGYQHPERVGDLVVVLDKGYTFAGKASKTFEPIRQVPGAPLGMHGYDPVLYPEMQGLMVLWKYPELNQGIELTVGIDSLRLHPTLAHLLGVKPSAKAQARPIQEILDAQ
jgi:predicted AlkP superfamily pyrophosphatase or phosphodiesterase